MKNDLILTSLINFLVPLILLYAFFSLAEYFESGFFSIIYSTVLFVIAFLIYSVKFTSSKPANIVSMKLISWAMLLIAVVYLILVLLFLIDLMPEIRV